MNPTKASPSRRGPDWPDERGWLAVALFALTAWVLYLTKPGAGQEPSEFFKTIATAIVVTGFLNGVVSFFYTSSKATAEAREQTGKALDLAHAAAAAGDKGDAGAKP